MSYNDHLITMRENKEKFERLLSSVKREGIEDLITWLNKVGFYTQPASTRYHNAFDGGLCDHSIKVFEILEKKINNFGLDKIYDSDTIKISSLLHDICKVGNYKAQMGWRKNEFNKWEQYPKYSYQDHLIPLGHGAKSVILLQNFLKLKKEEIQAIYWHMGLYDAGPNTSDFNKAAQIPLVILTHTSDMEASFIMETQGIQEELVKLEK